MFLSLAEFADDPLAAIKADFDRVFRSLLTGSDTTHTDSFLRIRTGLPHPIANMAIVRTGSDAELIAEMISPFCSEAFPAGVAFLEPPTNTVDALLASHGFQLVEQFTAMGVDLTAMTVEPPGEPLSVREAGTDEHDQWVDVMSAGYELPRKFVDRVGPGVVTSVAQAGEEWQYFMACRDDVPVGTATIVLRDGLASVYNISTLPKHRGEGIGGIVTSEPLRRVRERGYRTAILQASELGRPVYDRLGFRDYGKFPFYVRVPDA